MRAYFGSCIFEIVQYGKIVKSLQDGEAQTQTEI